MVSHYVAYAGRNYENWYYVVMGLILPFKFFEKLLIELPSTERGLSSFRSACCGVSSPQTAHIEEKRRTRFRTNLLLELTLDQNARIHLLVYKCIG
jgi:hypothetical protein